MWMGDGGGWGGIGGDGGDGGPRDGVMGEAAGVGHRDGQGRSGDGRVRPCRCVWLFTVIWDWMYLRRGMDGWDRWDRWDGMGYLGTLTNLTMNSLYRGYRGVLYLALPGSTWLYSTAHRVSA